MHTKPDKAFYICCQWKIDGIHEKNTSMNGMWRLIEYAEVFIGHWIDPVWKFHRYSYHQSSGLYLLSNAYNHDKLLLCSMYICTGSLFMLSIIN